MWKSKRLTTGLEPSPKQWVVVGFALVGVTFFEWLWIPYELPNGDVRYGFLWDPPRGIDPEEEKLFGSLDVPLQPREGVPITHSHDEWVKYFCVQQLCAGAVLLAAVVVYVKLEYR